MHDSTCSRWSRIRSTSAVLSLLSILSAFSVSAVWSSEVAFEKKPKPPKPPAGFPVAPGVYRLDGTDPNLGTADLEALRGIIGAAPIVGLGESIHTSGGYYETKHRVFRFLVEKMGFRALAFENNWEWIEPAAAYVQSCSGSPEEAMAGFYPVWRSTELGSLLQWMCTWNRTHPKPKDKIHLFGFDTQQPERDGPALLTFLERIGIAPDHPWVEAVNGCDGVRRFNPRPTSDDIYQPCIEALGQIQALFDQNTRQIVRKTSEKDLAWARIRLTGLRGWQGQAHFPEGSLEWWESRDGAMAYVFRSTRNLRYRNLKTAVWAHNLHLWENPHPSPSWARTMGVHLREAYGSGYISIALTSTETEIDWPLIGCGRVNIPRLFSVETRMASLGYDFLLADLQAPADPPFFEPGRQYVLHFEPIEPKLYFDAIIWIRHSRAMDALAWSCEG